MVSYISSMPIINKSAIVPYTAEQMFELVNDVAHYQEFVPWCVKSDVISQTPDEVRATLGFAHSGLHKSFSTINRLQPHKMIELRLLDGPFKKLEGFWHFEKIDDSHSRVTLDLHFEFSTKLIALMFGPLFNQVANTLVDCFMKRATQVYGHAN